MEKVTYIQTYCTIQDNKITLDGKTVFATADIGFANFVKEAYNHFHISYPKFFKMDNLSKLAFIAAELVLGTGTEIGANPINENTALVFANSSSCLDTDIKFQNSIADKNDYFPSPAVFVYTLPNICLGEISIKHQLKSENCFFISDDLDAGLMHDYATYLLNSLKAPSVLCGWVEYFGESYKAFLYLVTTEEQEGESGGKERLPHNCKTIETLFN